MGVDDFADSDLSPGKLGAIDGPAKHAFAVTPHDTNELAHYTRALYVGLDADVTVVMVGGETVQFKAVKAGTVLPIRVKIVTTATTASAYILGLW